jgi:hypothetical protein
VTTQTPIGDVRNQAKECLDEMKKISELISEVSQFLLIVTSIQGAATFLRKEYMVMSAFLVCFAVLLFFTAEL